MPNYRRFNDVLREDLKDPVEAKAYLDVCLEEYEQDNDVAAFIHCISAVIDAQGGSERLASNANLNPEDLTRLLASSSHLDTGLLARVLHALGYRLSVVRPTTVKEQETA